MDLDSPFSAYENDVEYKTMHALASPPLDTISLGHQPFQTDHVYYHPLHMDRKKRLEQDILRLENCVRRAVPYLTPKIEPGHEHVAAYHHHFFGAFEPKDTCYYGPIPYNFEYPSPFGVAAADLSSISESDRSPSPQALGHNGFSDIRTIDAEGLHAGYACHSTGYGSVIPRDVQHIHEHTFHEPESLVNHEVSQIYNPCASLKYHPQGEILNDLEITQDADAEGEPEAMCDDDIESKPTQRTSKMTKTKKTSRPRQTSAAGERSKSGVRKRTLPRKSGPNRKKDNKSVASKKPSAIDLRTYACSFKMYGCESTFSSKNEWKRHLSSQHLKLCFYRCDLEGCCQSKKGPNDFNRKDLFTQHLRRMHAPWSGKANPRPSREEKDRFELTLDEHHNRCRQEQRPPPPKSHCVICNQGFTIWQDRMEHMSKHYENNPHFQEPEDHDLVEWALREGILCRKGSSDELVLTDKRHRESKSIP